MPRLSTNRYSNQHSFLRKACLDFPHLFACLSSREQRVLYDFYISHRDLTESELLAYRTQVSAARPHLPAQAGKVFNRLYAVFCRAFELAAGDETRFYAELRKLTTSQPGAASTVYATGTRRTRRISVYPQLRPEPDVDRLVQALMRLYTGMLHASAQDDLPQELGPP